MAPEFQRNRNDAEEITGYIELGQPPQDQYEEVIMAVHPGFCSEEFNYTTVEGLRPEDYLRHSIDMHRDLEKATENGVPVDVVYRSGREQEALLYLGDHAEEVENFVESSYGNGFITAPQGQQDLSNTFEKIEDGGQMSLYGEINGLCLSQFEDLVREVERNLDKNIDIVKEGPFPEDPIDRTQGQLHWEDNIPVYIKALQSKSKFT